jgi:hypothetical protein
MRAVVRPDGATRTELTLHSAASGYGNGEQIGAYSRVLRPALRAVVLRRDCGEGWSVDPAEAAIDWDRQSVLTDAARRVRSVGEAIPEFWTGIHLQPDASGLVVFLAGEFGEHEPALREAAGPDVPVEFRRVRYTKAQLDAAYQEIIDVYASGPPTDDGVSMVSWTVEAIEVGLPPGQDDLIRDIAARFGDLVTFAFGDFTGTAL